MITVLATIFLFLISIFLLFTKRRRFESSKKLPPGSLGIPIIGQSLGLLRAMRTNTSDKWLEERIKKYGPISKLSLFGQPTIFISGPAANKLIFGSSDGNTLMIMQTKSMKMILGDRNLLGLSYDDHKRVRSALMLFLKPESLKLYVGKMEEEIVEHLETHWQNKQHVTVLPLMQTLTFDIMCTLVFGLERGALREKLVHGFERMMKGAWSVPINLPFTTYNHSIKASEWVQSMLRQLTQRKRFELANTKRSDSSKHQDLISCLLSIKNEDGKDALTETEVVHNVMLMMIAGYDTCSVLITFIMRFLAKKPSVYEDVLREQEEVARSKAPGESLTWEDLSKMKYTWRVAMETLRLVPPLLGGFRVATKDIEFGGYLIPKEWQIFWAASMTQMDGNISQEPTKFDPNRFENQKSVPPNSFVAFGGGTRLCPGNEFARIETLITIHYLVTRFTWKLCAHDSFIRDPMPVPFKGLPIQIFQKKSV